MTPPYPNSPEQPSWGDGGGASPPVQLSLPGFTPVVKKLMVINGVVFAGMFALFLISPPAVAWMVHWLGLDPLLWKTGFPFLPLWQLGSYAFMHSVVDPMHLLFNMLLLYFFGTMLERQIGPGRFLTLYLGAALVGGALHLVGEFALGAAHPAIGASGAVLGILIATAVLRPDTMVLFFFFPVRLRWLAVGIVALDALQLMSQLKMGTSDTVAHFVHLGGALYGFLAARRGWLRWDPWARWQARRADSLANQEQEDQKRLDALLKKIHNQGLGSLSRGEKEFLKSVSRRR